MQPAHTQQSELNAANLAAHAQAAATAAHARGAAAYARGAAAQAAASDPATPRAARGNVPAASAGAEPTDPLASMEQASDPGDNLTEISDATELQQREHQREHGDLVRLQQELKQEKERADKFAAALDHEYTLLQKAAKLVAARDQEHTLRQAAEQREAMAISKNFVAEQRLAAERAQFEQALTATRAERDVRPTLERLARVTNDFAAKVKELNVMRARMEAAELKAKQIVAQNIYDFATQARIKERFEWIASNAKSVAADLRARGLPLPPPR